MSGMRTLAVVRLATCRKRKFLSQNALAKAAGVSPATVLNIERGTVKTPRLSVIKKISEALEMDAAEIDEFKKALAG
jgi:transcriptional regulator with XRE-family HTH domain